MGTYRYCLFCDAALQRPTPEEDLSEHGQQCYSCDRYQPRAQSRDEWLIEAFSDIKELTEQIKSFDKRLTKISNGGFTKLNKRIQRLSLQNVKIKKQIQELKERLEKEYVI